MVTGYSTFPDIYNRCNWNDSILNIYFFFWTSFLYLPSFYFFTVFIIYWFFSKRLSIIFFGLFYVYNTELLDFLTNNYNYGSLNPLLLEVNLLLTNNLNRIHPFIFYVSTILLFVFVLQILEISSRKNNYRFGVILNLKSHFTNWVTFYNLLALFLGSWWAFQEGTWGGWWNWDSSEVFGLEFFLLTLYIMHTSLRYFTLVSWVWILNFSTILIWITYFFIQLNFDLVSHNFGVKFFFFFNNKLFFLVSLATLFLLLFYFIKTLTYVTSNQNLTSLVSGQNLNVVTIKTFLYLAVLYLFWGLVILLTFYPLLGYFIYNLTSWNIFNFTVTYNLLNYFFLFMLSYFIKTQSKVNNWLLFLLPLITWNFWFLLLTSCNFKTFTSSIHSLLILFFLLNVCSYQFLFLYPLESFYPNTSLTAKNFYWSHDKINILDTLFLEEISLGHYDLREWLVGWNFYLYSNTLALNNFQLLVSTYHVSNLYKLTETPFSYFIWIENEYTLILLLPILTLSYIFYRNSFSRVRY